MALVVPQSVVAHNTTVLSALEEGDMVEFPRGAYSHWAVYIGNLLSVTYCMVCAYVRGDNPRALARGLFPVQTHSHITTFLLHQHACTLCTLGDI